MNWTQVTAGLYDSFALNEKGELYSVGYNNEGQLGYGDKTYTNVLTLVSGFSGFIFNYPPTISVASPSGVADVDTTETELTLSEESLLKLDFTVSDQDADSVTWNVTLPASIDDKDGIPIGTTISGSCPATCSFNNILYLSTDQLPESTTPYIIHLQATDSEAQVIEKEIPFLIENR